MTRRGEKQRIVDSGWLRAEVGLLQTHHGLARHPYLVAWKQGRLSRGDLQILATEHDHVVVATAAAARSVARVADGDLLDALEALSLERAVDVERWRRFSHAAGWCQSSQWQYGADPFAPSVACAEVLSGSPRDSIAVRVSRLYAVIVAQRNVAPMQAAALQAFRWFDKASLSWFVRQSATESEVRVLEAAIRSSAHDQPFTLVRALRDSHQALWAFYGGLAANRVPTRPGLDAAVDREYLRMTERGTLTAEARQRVGG